MRAREAPLLYVVDATANVLFASVDAALSTELSATLQAVVRALKSGRALRPTMVDGRLVRTERLTASVGEDCYAVFLERVTRGGVHRSETPGTASDAERVTG